jgi:hypothetical protein
MCPEHSDRDRVHLATEAFPTGVEPVTFGFGVQPAAPKPLAVKELHALFQAFLGSASE